jgi:tetratricopeptide (TPR) repeat protein
MDYQPFPNTHWSLVQRAGKPDAAARRAALAVLLGRYQPALRSYLRVVKRLPADEADELLQAFIADQLLEHELIRRADQARGRFRTLLLTSLNNFAVSRGRAARRRAAEPLDAAGEGLAADAGGLSPDLVVEAAWARSLVHDVLQAMHQECTRTSRPDVWAVFEGRILAEVFGTGRVVPYEDLAAALQLESPSQAANLLVTAKRMYARLLRLAVGEYESDLGAIDAEIADLRRILAADVLGAAPGEE